MNQEQEKQYLNDKLSQCELVNTPRDLQGRRERYDMAKLQFDVGTWAHGVFTQSTNTSRIEHMRRELDELAEAPADPYEMADIALLLIHHANENGVNLLEAIRVKFDAIKSREWKKPDDQGVMEHV